MSFARTVLLAQLLLAPACSRILGTSDDKGTSEPIRAYPDGKEGLHELWTDILTPGRKDARARVHDLMATLLLTDEELVELFGPERARELGGRYRGLMATMINRGAIELCAQVYERKYDSVEV